MYVALAVCCCAGEAAPANQAVQTGPGTSGAIPCVRTVFAVVVHQPDAQQVLGVELSATAGAGQPPNAPMEVMACSSRKQCLPSKCMHASVHFVCSDPACSQSCLSCKKHQYWRAAAADAGGQGGWRPGSTCGRGGRHLVNAYPCACRGISAACAAGQ